MAGDRWQKSASAMGWRVHIESTLGSVGFTLSSLWVQFRTNSAAKKYFIRKKNCFSDFLGSCRGRIWQNSLLNCDTLDDIPSSVIVVPLLWLYSLGCTIIYMSILLISQVHPLAWNNLITQSNELSKCSLAIVISKVRFICINHKVLT